MNQAQAAKKGIAAKEMKIKSIGGEQGLIRLIKRNPKNKSVLVGIGDDAAIVKPGKKNIVLTTDLLVEDDHFRLEWSTPKQVGIKAMESNISDAAAMNAKPLYALVSISLNPSASVEFVKSLYDGLYSSARRCNIDIIGGDFAHGEKMVINIALMGELAGKPCLRSNAKPGDYIFVSGPLGASAAGLELLKAKKKGFLGVKKKHLQPKANLKKALQIGKIANAMEDVSDGLASEVKNICRESKCGAEILAEKVPISREVKRAGLAVGKNALDFALFGGEDFQLVFTVPQKYLQKAEKLGSMAGRILRGKKVFLVENGLKKELKKSGFDHFA